MGRLRAILPLCLCLFPCLTQGQAEELHLSVIVVYNNVPHNEKLTTAWGMSCVIEGMDKTILLDTGGDGAILLSNMRQLGIDRNTIDVVFISHRHNDHIGGLWRFLAMSDGVSVYVPKSFPRDLKRRVRAEGASLVSVDDFAQVFSGVYSTGEMPAPQRGVGEQSLIIDTPRGLVVITGCAHPGVVDTVKRARGLLNKDVYMLLGGFHLASHTDQEVAEITRELRELGVRKVGPSHCTGERATELLREAWGDDFLDFGCGARIEVTTTQSR